MKPTPPLLRRAALILACGLLAGTARGATLITDIDGWTATAGAAETGAVVASRRFEALLFSAAGRIVATGDADVLRNRALELGEPVAEVDGDGRFLMPGLIDAHGHFLGLGLGALQLDITGLRSLGATVERIREYARDGQGWILGGRWNQEHWPEARFPTAADLDGVSAETPDPPGGQILRDERGAALLRDYADDEGNRGLLFLDTAGLAAVVDRAVAKDFQVAVHAIGTRANRVTLDAYEQVLRERPASRALRHRVEHAQILVPEDLPRFAELGVVASMQPTHQSLDMFMAEKRLDPPRLAGSYAWRSLLESGAVLALGSDFPVEPPDPAYGIHAAVTRRNRDGEPVDGWRTHEALTLEQALRGFTLDAAWAARQEGSLGSLEAGRWPDFVLLEQNPFGMDPQDLWKLEVSETWVAGERKFRRR